MEAMEDTGPTTLARGLLRLNPRLMLMPGMVDMEAMDTDVDIASMVERQVTCSKSTRQTDF